MKLYVSSDSGVPIYLQIVAQVKHLLASRRLKAGQELPPIRDLAQQLLINPNTVARAYRLLHEEQIISTQQGRGTYVLGPPATAVSDAVRAERLAGMVRGWLAEAARLGYQPGKVGRTWDECFTAWMDARTV